MTYSVNVQLLKIECDFSIIKAVNGRIICITMIKKEIILFRSELFVVNIC